MNKFETCQSLKFDYLKTRRWVLNSPRFGPNMKGESPFVP